MSWKVCNTTSTGTTIYSTIIKQSRARSVFLEKKMFVAGNDISAKEQYTKVTRSRGMRLAKNWNAKTNGCR